MSENNDLILLAEDKKSKKGDGVNAVLVLMKDLRDFQDKVDTCLEAQAIAENKAKIAKFYTYLDKMYQDLLEIASGGIRKKREPEAREKPPVMVNTPVVPKM